MSSEMPIPSFKACLLLGWGHPGYWVCFLLFLWNKPVSFLILSLPAIEIGVGLKCLCVALETSLEMGSGSHVVLLRWNEV